jgi:hypothetical protein
VSPFCLTVTEKLRSSSVVASTRAARPSPSTSTFSTSIFSPPKRAERLRHSASEIAGGGCVISGAGPGGSSAP